ncbi:MAG: hypothetical protein O2779_02460 [Nanoarchaeota archaeon]|nr:hypothetical protein [Nanoarchaeota archaeon]
MYPFESKDVPLSKKARAWKVTKAVFLTKFNSNLLSFLIVAIISITGFHMLFSDSDITGNVIIEQNMSCPEIICPACVQRECTTDCSTCPTKTKLEAVETIKVRCTDGSLVDEGTGCELNFPQVDDQTSGTVSEITLSIGEIEFEENGNDDGFVNSIEYTIINKADYPIVPRIEVKVYKEWTSQVRNGDPNKNIILETVVPANSYITRTDSARIYFKGKQQKVRLLLLDTLPKKDEEIVAVVKNIDLD